MANNLNPAAPGTPSASPSAAQFTEHPLVQHLVPDAGMPIPSVAFTGFFGNSSKQGFMRLYLTQVLDEYLEISISDIRYTQLIQPPNSALGASTVWVTQNANVQHTVVTTRIAQADLIQADLSEPEAQCAAADTVTGVNSDGPPTKMGQSTAVNSSRSNIKNN